MGKLAKRTKNTASGALSVTKKASLKSLKLAKNTGKISVRVAKKIPQTRTYQKAHRSYKVVHNKCAVQPHQWLMEKSPKYASWHSWRYKKINHSYVHLGALILYVIFVGMIIFNNIGYVFAADLSNNWDFSTPADYQADSGVDISGNNAHLKSQEYSPDGNTSALYHLNETSGSSVDDSSTNNNDGTTTNSPSWNAGNMNNGLSLNGSNQYVSAPDSPSLSVTGSNTVEAWSKLNNNFNAGSSQYRQTILDKGQYQLYYDNETGKITYELENSGANTWTQQAGYDMLANNGAKVNHSWDQNGKNSLSETVKMGSKLYVALSGSTNDAEVWEYDISSGLWSQIAGDGLNYSWNNEISTNAYEGVLSLATNGTDTLYAGLGAGTNDADIWRFKSGSWSKIGGDGLNSSWAGSAFNSVYALAVDGDTLWAGLGNGGNMAQVWSCTDCSTNPNWGGSRLGGYSGTARGWGAGYEIVYSMAVIDGKPIAGLGSTAGDGEVWQCTSNCTTPGSATWAKLGGDGSGSGGQSWGSAEYVLSMTSDGNDLYVGTGLTANADANVWKCDTSTSCSDTSGWTKIGSAVNFGTDKEGVYGMRNNGGTLYVGLGSSAGDDEVWRYNGSWAKIGGDNVNSGWNATHTNIKSLLVDGSTVYAGLSSGGEAYMWKCNNCDSSPNWGGARIGGKYVNKSWGQYGIDSVESSTTVGGKLYIGTGNNAGGDATVWVQDPTTNHWSIVGGQGINSSWPVDTHEAVWSMTNYKNKLYVGLGSSANDAEVWRYDDPGWTKVADGSPAVGSAWGANYESVYSLGVANDKLYAGLGASSGDGEVWECTGCDGGSPNWGGSAIGGTASGNWGVSSYAQVGAMATYRGSLYATVGGGSAGLAEVWKYSGSSTNWTKVGGDGVNSSWANSVYEDVYSLVVWNDKLVAGLGYSGSGAPNNDAEVWSCTDCDGGSPTWAKIGGDSNGSDNMGWLDSNNYERVRSMTIYNGDLYAGLGFSTGDAEVWRYNGSAWTQVGGDGVNSSWLDSYVEDVSTMVVHNGKLYVSTGNTVNSDAMVWSYGDNGYLQSSTDTHNTNWHHIAGRYNGTTMEIFIDGVSVASANKTFTMPDGGRELLLGKSYGGFDNGRSQGFFEGSLDEVRISNVARGSFTTKPYVDTEQAVTLANKIRESGVASWDGFTSSENLNGGTIKYRLSDDDGTTWKYWNGSSWTASSGLSQSNPVADINSHIGDFPVTFSGIRWQAVLKGDGTQKVELDDVTLTANSDSDSPGNVSNLRMYKSNGGDEVLSNAWTNMPTPYFSWDNSTDGGSGMLGYCLYLGTSNSADPATTKGLLGTSPVNNGGNCQFTVGSNSVDLSTSGYLSTALTTSTSPYYLIIKGIDKAGNLSASSTQFQFRFDNIAPTNPGYITAPSQFVASKEVTFTWPTSGSDSPSDDDSGVSGLQYRIGPSSSWYGDGVSGAGFLANDGNYTTRSDPDFPNINEGINTVYFRTWDQAGNVTTSYATAALKLNNTSPSGPQNVVATPATNTTNSFAFSWSPPASFSGPAGAITYCYTVNATPTVNNCTFTNAGVTSLPAGAFATQPGDNTFYVVAKDEAGNINYATSSSVVFTANTSAPGIPLDLDIADVSIKSSSSWRLALTWTEPTNTGAGIASYKILRSTDNSHFTKVASTSGTSYVDTGLSQTEYFYKVSACDSANNCGAESAVDKETPTGKFTSPANLISQPNVTGISTKKATIKWATDRASDSKISLGTKSGEYAPFQVASPSQVTDHDVDLNNLTPGTTYYAKAVWTDEDGNTGMSHEFTFSTTPAPSTQEVNTQRVTLSSAQIRFTSVSASKVVLQYGKSDTFGGIKEISTSLSKSTYDLEISGLDDGTKYFYRLNTFDEDGNEYPGSTVLTFTTPARPRIENLRFQPIDGEPTSSQKITWTTNVPSSSLVRFSANNSPGKEVTSSELVTEHEITVRDLLDDTEYTLVAESRDRDGNLATSDKQTLKTALDTRPPKIKDVTVETSIRGSGAEARGQIVVSWKTDEPATSQVAYAEGSDAKTFNNKTSEDSNMSLEHIVIVSDLPTSRVYSVQPISKDRGNNAGTGDTKSAIIGRASDSVMTIVLNTLRKVFGF